VKNSTPYTGVVFLLYETMELDQYIIENYGSVPNRELALEVNRRFKTQYTYDSIRHKHNRLKWRGDMARKKLAPKEQVSRDLETSREKKDVATLSKKNKVLLAEVERLREEIQSFEKIEPVNTFTIQPKNGATVGEATVVVLASDWHIEERVDPDTINDLNTHNLSIARKRATEFFQAALRLTQILGKDVEINTMILALLGDFITGDIHEEMLETAEVEPALAIIEAQKILASGIQFILDNSKLNLVIPCHSGNHARTTKESRHATEAGHSLEYIMYHMLADHFRGNNRVKFIIPRSYHSFVTVYDEVIRFHHGHNLRYGGGVGGLTIPVNKAIAQWNKSRKDVTLDCFGHWHTRFDGGNFIANGSNIGFNAFAVSIKASYDKPSQTLFLIDKKRGKTCVWPILYSV
jgi:hypothetical protein